ncbi:3'-5' exonuclease [bacterium]|nr:3'-5' exonuclease [bacterium]
MSLNLKRPLAVIDLETTGFDVESARIVSIGITIIDAGGNIQPTEEIFINPGIKIPKETTDVHGITDEMAKDWPLFKDVAPQIADKLEDCDLSGFNIDQYDLPILKKEFGRVGVEDFGKDAKVIDVMKIYNKNVDHGLSSAVTYYLGRFHKEAHSSAGDSKATAEVFLKQVGEHNLSGDAGALQEYCCQKSPNFIDQEGKFIWSHSEAVINFGRLRGTPLKEVAENNRDYLEWILAQDFSDEIKGIVNNILAGSLPKK